MVGVLLTALVLLALPLAASGAQASTTSGATVAARQSEQDSSLKCGNSTPLDAVSGDAHPVILIHGWIGQPMVGTRTLLARLPDHQGRQFLLFDYSHAATSWPDTPEISQCLARYIAAVAKKNHDRGGDGMVYLVAHSMGGLAIRFALSPTYGDPSLVKHIGGVVTLDTPYTGSMWGNTFLGWVMTNVAVIGELLGLRGLPPGGARAWQCLATQGTAPAAPGCAVPPTLPEQVRLTQVAGDVSVERSMFGLHAYTYNLGGDGIVSQDSQWGSLGSDHKLVATQADFQRVECTMSADKLLDASPALPWNVWADNFLIDLYEGKLDLPTDPGMVGAAASTLAQVMGAACSHLGMPRNPEAIGLVDDALTNMIARQRGLTKPADLLNASIPASCRHPAARLHGYKRDFGPDPSTGQDRGFANLQMDHVVFGDVTGDGRSDAAVPLLCSAGGVSWPQLLLVYGPGPFLEGTFDLGTLPLAQEHVGVDKMSVVGSTRPQVAVAFTSYEGAGFGTGTYTGTLGWSSGKPTFDHSDALTLDYATNGGQGDLGIGYGVIHAPGDVAEWMPGAPTDFADFIRGEWRRDKAEVSRSCPSSAVVWVAKYSHLGFASGGEGGCEGADYVWAKQDGRWRTINVYQDGPYCASASAVQKRAYYVLGIGCYPSDVSSSLVGKGPWPTSGQ